MAEETSNQNVTEENQEQGDDITVEVEDFEEGDTTTANGQDGAKEAKPILTGDAEADEHDIISMPTTKVVTNDLQFVHRSRRVVVHTATMYDMVHDVIGEVMRNQVCDDISFQFVRGKDAETGMLGVINMTFTSTKQASEYVPYLQSIRPDLVVEQAPQSDIATNLVCKWKKERAASNPATESMLLVKNLDPATASVDKLAAIFPDAEDIVIASQPDASNTGKLKGRKHAYLLYKSQDDAAAALDAASANPLELDGQPLIVCRYKEPPAHIPDGYLTLSARKLVLRHMARFKGLLVRAQEDPLLPVKDEWNERLKHSTELIEKDDAARDLIGLPKPTLVEFKDMTNLKNLTGRQQDVLLVKLKLAEKSDLNNSNKKRFAGDDSKQPKKMARGAASSGGRGRGASSGVKPLMSARPVRYGFSTGAGCSSGIGFSMGGGGFSAGYGGYDDYGGDAYGGRTGFSYGGRPSDGLGSVYGPRLSLLRAAARAALRGSRGGWM